MTERTGVVDAQGERVEKKFLYCEETKSENQQDLVRPSGGSL